MVNTWQNFFFYIKIEIGLFEISNVPNFHKFLSIFNFGTNLGLIVGKYFMKFIFDFKIKIGIFEISTKPNFNEFWVFFILLPIGA